MNRWHMTADPAQLLTDLTKALRYEDAAQRRGAYLVLDFLRGSDGNVLELNSALWALGMLYALDWQYTDLRDNPVPTPIKDDSAPNLAKKELKQTKKTDNQPAALPTPAALSLFG